METVLIILSIGVAVLAVVLLASMANNRAQGADIDDVIDRLGVIRGRLTALDESLSQFVTSGAALGEAPMTPAQLSEAIYKRAKEQGHDKFSRDNARFAVESIQEFYKSWTDAEAIGMTRKLKHS